MSKAFHLIRRFSEDIDLILDWRVLGYGINEPWQVRSNTKQDKFKEEADHRAEKFLAEEFVPSVKTDLSRELGAEAEVYVDPDNLQVVNFAYPRIFTGTGILQIIRLEIGALAAWTPAKLATIRSYAAEYYPQVFSQADTTVLTVTPERTFWEKATILHQEANRPGDSDIPMRYSRHYYDLYQMANSPVKENAIAEPDLLQKVVDFKMKFYRRPWAKYPEAKPGTLRLNPPDYRLPELRKDYVEMQEMLFGDIPSFDTIINGIRRLENDINSKG